MNTTQIIQRAVIALNLTDTEARTYDLLITQKKPTISQISKQLNLNRIQVYDAIERLSLVGLISKESGRTKNFKVESPSKLTFLLNIAENNLQKIKKQVDNVLPDILYNFESNSNSQKIKIYESSADFNNLFLEMYEQEQKEILFMGDADIFTDFIDKNFIDFGIIKRIEKGITHKVLAYPPAFSLQAIKNKNVKELREVKFLSKEFSNPGYVHIFGSKILNWNPILGRAILIEDRVIAEFYKSIFKQIWDSTDKAF